MRTGKVFALLAAAAFLFSGCGGAAPVASSAVPGAAVPAASGAAAGTYVVPAFCESAFHAGQAAGENGVLVDLSAADKGYIAVSAKCESRLKFQVICGEETYTYDLPADGSPAIYPLNCGSGGYTFRAMKNIGDSQYVALYSTQAEVALSDERAPFLCPSQMVNYTENSDCVAEMRTLAAHCDTDAEVAAAVYAYLTQNITYDYEKAKTVEKGYLPDPDTTLAEKKGICFDYAALAAAMLRSAGVPTRLVTGYVGDIYHAWNEVYLENEGWIAVEIAASKDSWQRIDATFAASGVEPSFLTDDGNYITRYTY